MQEILLGLTTTPGSDWRGKVEEMKKFNIEKIALFPTFLEIDDRRELYKLLEEIDGLEIPHVHLRSQDMDTKEVEYLIKKFGAQVFNVHPAGLYPIIHHYAEYKSQVFIENMPRKFPLNEDEVNKYGGICLDFSHWEDGLMQADPSYGGFSEIVAKNKIGCCHVSAITKELHPDRGMPGEFEYCCHTLGKLSEMDYMKKYIDYLPEYISIELENTFERQLEVKAYLEKLLNI